jgi:peptidyl-prolyl cis-trans isomerase D
MSTLSRIRQNIGLIAIVIFIALAAFILTDFFRGITTVLQGVPEAGLVAGEEVGDREYQEQVSLYMQNAGGNYDDLQSCQLRNQVWDQVVREKLYAQELEKVGLQVTAEELYQMFAGEEVSPLVRSLLGIQPGQEVTQTQMKRFLEQLQQTQPEQLAQLEEVVARERGIERYNRMIAASYLGSTASARRQHRDRSRSVNLSFLSVPYTSIPDSAYPVSDAELIDYMEEHEEQYTQDEQTIVRFVRFRLQPTRSDSMQVYNNVLRQKQTFASISNDSVYTIGKTRQPFRGTYRLPSALPVAVRDSIVEGEVGTVFGPMREADYFKLYKLVDAQDTSATSVKVNHILITYDNDSAAALSEAREALSAARSDFTQAAADYSDDPGTKNQGGAIGWYRPGQFGEGFDQAVESASVGSIIGPIEGRGGYHVVEIVDKDDRAYAVAQVEEQVIYSKQTRDSVYGVANNFAANLQSSGDISQTASKLGFPAFQSNRLTKSDCSIGGGINGGREMVVWAVNADIGATGKGIFVVGDNYVVAQVTERIDEGLQPLDEVRDKVRTELLNQKKAAEIKAKLEGLTGQDLNAMRDAYGTGATVKSANNISFSSSSIPGLGTDRLAVGKALSLEQGETSGPVVGENAVFILQVTDVNEAPELDEATLAQNAQQRAQQQRMTLQNTVSQALREMSEVQDNRIEAERRRYNVE